MSNRRKSRIRIKCQKDNCENAAVGMRKAPHDLGGSLTVGQPIFACADHIQELERDLAHAVELHERMAEREQIQNNDN